jgi:hypothetical protein
LLRRVFGFKIRRLRIGPSIGEIVGIIVAVLVVLVAFGVGMFFYMKTRRMRRRKPRKDLGLSMELDLAPISGRTQDKYEEDDADPVGREDKYEFRDNGRIREPEPVRYGIRYPDPDDDTPSGNTHWHT